MWEMPSIFIMGLKREMLWLSLKAASKYAETLEMCWQFIDGCLKTGKGKKKPNPKLSHHWQQMKRSEKLRFCPCSKLMIFFFLKKKTTFPHPPALLGRQDGCWFLKALKLADLLAEPDFNVNIFLRWFVAGPANLENISGAVFAGSRNPLVILGSSFPGQGSLRHRCVFSFAGFVGNALCIF